VRNAQADAVAAAAQPNLLAAQAQLTNTQPLRDRLAVQGLNIQGETQTAQQQVNADGQEMRKLTQELAKESADHLANQDAIGRMQQSIFARLPNLNLPKTVTGSPDFANMSDVQRQAFDALAKASGIPGSNAVAGGDTARGDSLWQKLAASGKYSPAVLQANAQAIRNTYNSTSPALAGNDALAVASATAGNIVGFEEQDANSWGYGAGDATARNDYDGLAARIPELLKDNTSGFGKEKDIVYIQRLLRKVALQGVETKSGEKIVPSVRDMESLIRGSVGSWYNNENRSDNIESALKEWFQTSNAQKMIANGERSRAFRLKQKMIQTQRELLNPGSAAPKK
jgi:hypothetical protein